MAQSKINEYCSQNKEVNIDDLKEYITDDLLQVFKPEFLGRINVIPYLPLSEDTLVKIAHLQLTKIENRIKENYNAKFSYSANTVKKIVENSDASIIGARTIEQLISREILPDLSMELLNASVENKVLKEITLKYGKDGKFSFKF